MPELQAPFTLAGATVGVAYNEPIEAIKVVGMNVSLGPDIADGGSYTQDRHTVQVDLVFTIESDSEDDLVMPSNPVSVSGQTNCTATVHAQPGSLTVEPGDSTTFTIRLTPTAPGAFDFDVSIDNDSTTGEDPYNFSVNGDAYDLPTITNATLAAMEEGTAYSDNVDVTGGKSPLAFSVSAGTLPAGLSLNATTGEISGTPTTAGAYDFTVLVTDDLGGTNSQQYTGEVVDPYWDANLVEAIETATGLNCTHAAFAQSPTAPTTKNIGGDPAADGDRVYRIFDLFGDGYDYIEGASNKGGIYRAASVGTRGAIEFDRTNQEYMKTVIAADTGTPDLVSANDHTVIVVGKFSDNNVDQSTLRFNPLIWGSSDMSSSSAAEISLLLRDTTGVRIGCYGAGAAGPFIEAADAPYDTPLVLSLRNKLDPSGVVTIGANKVYDTVANNASITSLTKVYHMALGADYLSGHIAAVIALDGYIDDATMDDVVDLVEAAFGF